MSWIPWSDFASLTQDFCLYRRPDVTWTHQAANTRGNRGCVASAWELLIHYITTILMNWEGYYALSEDRRHLSPLLFHWVPEHVRLSRRDEPATAWGEGEGSDSIPLVFSWITAFSLQISTRNLANLFVHQFYATMPNFGRYPHKRFELNRF